MKNSLTHKIQAYYRVVWLCIAAMLFTTLAHAQVGDYLNPLQYSTHTYSVTMGNINNAVLWNIYNTTATRARIDADLETPFPTPLAYVVISTSKSAGQAHIEIEFSGSLAVGTTYRLAYREESADNCYDFQFLDFTIQAPFDVDILPVADQCPDIDDFHIEGTGTPTSRTTVAYRIEMQTENYDVPGNWFFNYAITVIGDGGPSATIESVTYTGYSWTQPSLLSSFSGTASIPNSSTEVTIYVTYNDVYAVRQRIDFALTQIEGTFGDRDVDEVNGTLGQNEIRHYIEPIPAAGYIAALD